MTMPAQKPGTSRQDFGTPKEFLGAVRNLLGITTFAVDLAADHTNFVTTPYITAEDNSLGCDWGAFTDWRRHEHSWCWLNPPFSHIEPWAAKCAVYGASRVKIALLVPASVGSEWFKNYVKNHAYVLELNGRLSFDGNGPYPKDCVLALYGTPFRGSATWDWRKYVPEPAL